MSPIQSTQPARGGAEAGESCLPDRIKNAPATQQNKKNGSTHYTTMLVRESKYTGTSVSFVFRTAFSHGSGLLLLRAFSPKNILDCFNEKNTVKVIAGAPALSSPAVSYNPGTENATPLWSRTPHVPQTTMYATKLDNGIENRKGGEYSWR